MLDTRGYYPAIALFLAVMFQSQLYASINILNSGAKGDCITNDAAAINAAIQTLATSTNHSGEVYFPKPPGGCYLVDEAIQLPGGPSNFAYNVVISLVGEGRGVSVIKAGAAMNAVLQKDAFWDKGDTVTDMTFDANGLAKHAIDVEGGTEIRFTRIEGLNGTVDDLRLDAPTNTSSGEDYVSDSFFLNTKTFPPYNIYVGTSTDNKFTDNVMVNASVANVIEATGGSNHFISNHAYGWPAQFCPTYSYITAFTSIWIGNQSDCSNEAAFLVNNWQALIEGNFIQGAANHGICISPKAGGAQVIGNNMSFNNPNASPDNAIVQGVMEGGQVSCKGPGVRTATWGNSLNYGASNIVMNNWPASNESLWTALFTGSVNQSPAIGIGTTAPHATLDINGFARLTSNASAPAACEGKNKGAIALNSASHICICDGSSWKLDSSGQACPW
ncbi:MAG: glycosyl hydrolase family 28-related protein [Terriglobales bacterium]